MMINSTADILTLLLFYSFTYILSSLLFFFYTFFPTGLFLGCLTVSRTPPAENGKTTKGNNFNELAFYARLTLSDCNHYLFGRRLHGSRYKWEGYIKATSLRDRSPERTNHRQFITSVHYISRITLEDGSLRDSDRETENVGN